MSEDSLAFLQNVVPKAGTPVWGSTEDSTLSHGEHGGGSALAGFMPIIVMMVIVIPFFLWLASRGGSRGALVLKRFQVDREASSGEYIEIHGRKPGFVAFLLSAIGIDPTTVFKCNAERIEVKEASLFGSKSMTIPLAAVTGIAGGHLKPVLYLALAVILLGFGLVGLALVDQGGGVIIFGITFALAVICVVVYALRKQVGLHVQNGGDKLYGLAFTESVIEGVDVDIARVEDTIRIINWLVVRATGRSSRT
jgi:hypothetical protein